MSPLLSNCWKLESNKLLGDVRYVSNLKANFMRSPFANRIPVFEALWMKAVFTLKVTSLHTKSIGRQKLTLHHVERQRQDL